MIVIQDELAGAAEPTSGFSRAGCDVRRFSALNGNDWQAFLRGLDPAAASNGAVMCFVSINVAEFISRNCPNLSPGLHYRPEPLHYHFWSSLVPRDLLLNREFIMLPVGRLSSSSYQLGMLFGDELFLRPDSPRKPFSGLTCKTTDVGKTASVLKQVHALSDDCLLIIDRARPIEPHEYRFWLDGGGVAASAAYTFAPDGVDQTRPAPPCPATIQSLAENLLSFAPLLETIDEKLVADFAIDEMGLPRLVELNAWSTSGFYPGVDFSGIAAAAVRISG